MKIATILQRARTLRDDASNKWITPKDCELAFELVHLQTAALSNAQREYAAQDELGVLVGDILAYAQQNSEKTRWSDIQRKFKGSMKLLPAAWQALQNGGQLASNDRGGGKRVVPECIAA